MKFITVHDLERGTPILINVQYIENVDSLLSTGAGIYIHKDDPTVFYRVKESFEDVVALLQSTGAEVAQGDPK